MKKHVKWIIIGAVVLVAVVGGVFYVSMPAALDTVTLAPKTAELYFTEQGTAASLRKVEVYAAIPGVITEVFAAEGQSVAEGDPLFKLDYSDFAYQIQSLEGGIRAYEAQAGDLAEQERQRKDSLSSSKSALTGQLHSMEAQEASAGLSLEEQLKLQDMVIASREADLAYAKDSADLLAGLQKIASDQFAAGLERAKDGLKKAQALYDLGEISKQDLDTAANAAADAQSALDANAASAARDAAAASTAVGTAQSALDQAKTQRSVVEKGGNSPDYYAALKRSLADQIASIDAELANSPSAGMAKYYAALIDSNKASIDGLNKKIEQTLVSAPADGVLTSLNVKDSNMAGTAAPAAVISSDKNCSVEVYVSIRDIDQVTPGKQVILTLEGRLADKTSEGTVAAVGDSAEVKYSALGVEERKVKVTISPDDPAIFGDGYTVSVKFTYYSEDNKLTVPKTAVFKENGKDMVWIVKNGAAHKNEVTKGVELRTEFVIDSGLSAGERVISDASQTALREGLRVK